MVIFELDNIGARIGRRRTPICLDLVVYLIDSVIYSLKSVSYGLTPIESGS
jgi:hypothetical protein